MSIGTLLTALAAWWRRLFAPPSKVAGELPPIPTRGPAVGTQPLHNRFGGRQWRYDGDGVHSEGVVWRTAGQPLTCRAILDLYAAPIFEAGERHGVNAALIVMTIATETSNLRRDGFTGRRSFRWEGHVTNRDVSPEFKGTYSAGPMQVLATTARDLIVARRLPYSPFDVAPAYRTEPWPAPASHPLYDPAISIDLGAAYIRRFMHITGDDPILVAAVYNAGGLYESPANPWRLRSHADHLDRAARWYGDACAVLREARGV